MSRADSDTAYEKFVVPESRNIPRSASKFGKIDFAKPHAPLLIIAGADDNIIPQVLVEKNRDKYTDKNSRTDFKSFPNRGHFICGQPGWEEVAAYVAEWVGKLN